MNYRLGLDMGTTSIGWSILNLQNGNITRVIDMGVRIFDDGRDAKTKEPLAVTRRNKRGERRRRDRFIRRKKRLILNLVKYKIWSADVADQKRLETLDPYLLRAKGLDEKLELPLFGRALFHLNQRRGFKSNRKDLQSGDSEKGIMKEAIHNTKKILINNNARTLGEYLYNLNKTLGINQAHLKKSLRFKKQTVGNKSHWNIYPDRQMIEDEFDQLWDKQKTYHPNILTDEAYKEIKKSIFWQRRLKAPKIGKCRFLPSETRCPKALPSFQQFKVLQNLNHLKIKTDQGFQNLTEEQLRLLHDEFLKNFKLYTKKADVAFSKMKKLIGLTSNYEFNFEFREKDRFNGVLTDFNMMKDEFFGPDWLNLPLEKRDTIINLILNDTLEDEDLIQELIKQHHLSPEKANRIINVPLESGYGSLCHKVINDLLPYLYKGFIYSDACEKAGYNHSQIDQDQCLDKLLYYAELMPDAVMGASYDPNDPIEKQFGKINNPTVHIALNQLRKLINALIAKYGKPTQVVVELARELKLGPKKYKALENFQKERTKENEKIDELLKQQGVAVNRLNRQKYRLWQELAETPQGRQCPFTPGKTISMSQLFSDEIEIEHIIPFSLCFNDSMANKTVCYRSANREKGQKTPYQAFGHTDKWIAIFENSKKLHKNKQWRFLPNALEKMSLEDSDMIARQLTDTQYMSRLTLRYLKFLGCQVWNSPGQLTALLRKQWQLNFAFNLEKKLSEIDSLANKKQRIDHRHHAVDAFVIACTSHSLLQQISNLAKRYDHLDKLKLAIPYEPYPGYERTEIIDQIEKIVVSHKPDHRFDKKNPNHANRGSIGALHEETNYGLVNDSGKKLVLKIKKNIMDLNDIKKIQKISDDHIRKNIEEIFKNKKGKEFTKALEEYSIKNQITTITCNEVKSKETLIPIYDKQGTPYRYTVSGNNFASEIYITNKGKDAKKWRAQAISNFAFAQKNYVAPWKQDFPMGRKIMRLQINDFLAFEINGKTTITRIKKLSKDRIFVVPHNLAKTDDTFLSKVYNFGYAGIAASKLQQKSARKVSVDILGQVLDPVAFKKNEQTTTGDHP